MKKIVCNILLIYLGLSVLVGSLNAASRKQHIPASPYHAQQLLVKLKPNLSMTQKASLAELQRFYVPYALGKHSAWQLITLKSSASLHQVKVALETNPAVEKVEYNMLYRAQQIFNDNLFSRQWALNNTAQEINAGIAGTHDVDINAAEAWDLTYQSHEVVVAVLDSGTDYNHEDLLNRLWQNPGETAADAIDNDGNGLVDDVYGYDFLNGDADVMDDNGHGTHVAGIIAAEANNAKGVAGVVGTVNNIKILTCKVGDNTGTIDLASVLLCMDYLYELKTRTTNPVNIVLSNNSWGGNTYSQALADAVNKHAQAGILFINAAGNDGANIDVNYAQHFPAALSAANSITVAASDYDDAIASFSNYGQRSTDLFAPGDLIAGTFINPPATYQFMSGTSMAAPHVSGVAALLAAYDSSYDWITIKNFIIAGATPIAHLKNQSTSGRRLRAYDSVNNAGALNCNQQAVTATLWPLETILSLSMGSKLGLRVQNISCAQAAGMLQVQSTGPLGALSPVYLLDNGQGFDQIANDGVYAAFWPTPSTAGAYTLSFPDGQEIAVTVQADLAPYRLPQSESFVEQTGFQYSDTLDDASYLVLTPGFNIPFANSSNGFANIYVGLHGYLSFSPPELRSEINSSLPSAALGSDTIIAAYWDELGHVITSNNVIEYGIFGSSPNREFTIQWRDITHASLSDSAQTIRFQVSLYENSSDIVMRYVDTQFGDVTLDDAASATIGVQASANSASMQVLNQVQALSGTSWRWRVDSGGPTNVTAGNDQLVLPNASVDLTGSASDPDSGVLNYQWVQILGPEVVLTNSNSEHAMFTAPASDTVLGFQMQVSDDAGRTATAIQTVLVDSGSSAGVIEFDDVYVDVSEATPQVQLTLSRKFTSNGVVSVDYVSHNGFAMADSDYISASGTVTWQDREMGSQTINVNIIDDDIVEDKETFFVQLGNVVNASLGVKQLVSVRILDDDLEPQKRQSERALCVIATAAYGSPMATQIQSLRNFRDQYLQHHLLGKAFIQIYYRYGKVPAEWIAQSETRRGFARVALAPLMALLQTLQKN
ncbi:MAG: S8 family serine peptidase [Gammaproteobacteria bacterium]|nr:S8 family serine peptidase [Gammaproteobacteria bacterium]